MQKATVENIELGNLIFGHSRGEYAIDRDTYQDMFLKFLEANGFDEYGFSDVETGRATDGNGCFHNGMFVIRPYYWGDDPDTAALPNFKFKPGRVSISWYKYPLRDAYCSHDLTPEQFQAILNQCAASLRD